MVAVAQLVIKMRIICPLCKKIVARIDDGVMVQGSAKCNKCGKSFGYTNVRNIEEMGYIY